MKKYLSAFVCGFGAGVLHIVPLVKSFSCCLIIPVAAFLALVLDQRASRNSKKIPMKKAMVFGLLTGLYAAIFGSIFEIVITYITKHNDIVATFPELQRMIQGFPVSDEIKTEALKLFQNVRDEILARGFSLLYTFSILINYLIIDTIFGTIGGLIGAQVINSRINKNEL
ncbi:MAG: hypothetical protein AB1298_08615 [Bacteroidota bacterium]